MRGKLNKLERILPEGLLVDSGWMNENGYANSLRAKYVASGRLEQPARRVYRRPRGTLDWPVAVLSLQTLLDYAIVVGGRTALEMQGYAHYLPATRREVHLYGDERPPTWLADLTLDVAFRYHPSQKLFAHARWFGVAKPGDDADPSHVLAGWAKASTLETPLGHWQWPLKQSTPERALLELLDELPDHESFDQVDALMGGLATLSPRRLQKLLDDCVSVKVKRLFFFFADRHGHAWLKALDRSTVNLGSGNRVLVKGGRLDPAYAITVPRSLDAVQ
jgi:hypothetical protein